MTYSPKRPPIYACLRAALNEAQRIRVNQAQLCLAGIRQQPDHEQIKRAEEFEAIGDVLTLVMDDTAGFKKFVQRVKGKNADAYGRILAAADQRLDAGEAPRESA